MVPQTEFLKTILYPVSQTISPIIYKIIRKYQVKHTWAILNQTRIERRWLTERCILSSPCPHKKFKVLFDSSSFHKQLSKLVTCFCTKCRYWKTVKVQWCNQVPRVKIHENNLAARWHGSYIKMQHMAKHNHSSTKKKRS